MFKILQARLQQYMNWEIPDVQTRSRKGRGTRDQIAKFCWIIEKARECQKHIYFCFTDNTKAFNNVYHNKLWKILKDMGRPDHLNWIPRNLYAGQEATVRTGRGIMDWFKIGKRVCQGYELSPCFFKLLCRVHHVKYWAGWPTNWKHRRNINDLAYADDATLMAKRN